MGIGIKPPVLPGAADKEKAGSLMDQALGNAPEESEYLANQMRVSLRKYILIKGATHFSFLREAGEWVEKGDALFEVVDPLSDRVTVVCAGTSGQGGRGERDSRSGFDQLRHRTH